LSVSVFATVMMLDILRLLIDFMLPGETGSGHEASSIIKRRPSGRAGTFRWSNSKAHVIDEQLLLTVR
jgi:hypothetical protein